MAERHPHGLFSWTVISLPEPEKGRDFYASLFGWEAEDQFDPDGTTSPPCSRWNVDPLRGWGRSPNPWRRAAFLHCDGRTSASMRLRCRAPTRHRHHAGVRDFTSGRMAVIADPTRAAVSLYGGLPLPMRRLRSGPSTTT